MMMKKIVLLLSIVLSLTVVAGNRKALVVGNYGYELSPLANPINDAREIAKALKSLSFDVTHLDNLTRSKFKSAIRNFTGSLDSNSEVIFYYAGHAVQYQGLNFLVPIGAEIRSEDEIEEESLNINFLLKKLSKVKAKVNILILDSCRNNPFERSFSRGTSDQGLAALSAPVDSYIAFSTSPGRTASDGNSDHSPFTQAILNNISKDGLSINQVFQRVRSEVITNTDGEQTPFDNSSLRSDFCFLDCNSTSIPGDTDSDVVILPPPRDMGIAQVKELTNLYYTRSIGSDQGELLNMYNFPVGNYFDQNNLSKEIVRKQMGSYFSLWKKREGKLKKVEVDLNNSTNDTIKVTLVYKYKFVKTNGKRRRGKSTNQLIYRWLNGKWKIISVYETVN